MRRASAAVAALSLMLGAVACAEDARPDAQTAYFDVYLDDDVRACGRQLEDYDRFTERIFDVWTGGDPGDLHAEVYVTRKPCLGSECSLAGHARGGRVRLAYQYAQYHELAHLMHFATDGGSAPSINEGVAEVLGPTFPATGAPWVSVDSPPDMLFADRFADVDYSNAAMFTRMLIEDHGVEAFRTYARAMDREPRAPEDFEREFAAAFGEPLDVAWQRYLSEPEARCTYDFWFCDERRPIELPFETAIECDHPDALGFEAPPVYSETYDIFSFPYSPRRIFHLDLTTSRTVQFEIANAVVRFGRCGSCPDQQPLLVFGGDPLDALHGDIELELPPGTWAFVADAQPESGSPRFAMTPLD